MSTNKPGIGAVVLEIGPWNFDFFFQNFKLFSETIFSKSNNY